MIGKGGSLVHTLVFHGAFLYNIHIHYPATEEINFFQLNLQKQNHITHFPNRRQQLLHLIYHGDFPPRDRELSSLHSETRPDETRNSTINVNNQHTHCWCHITLQTNIMRSLRSNNPLPQFKLTSILLSSIKSRKTLPACTTITLQNKSFQSKNQSHHTVHKVYDAFGYIYKWQWFTFHNHVFTPFYCSIFFFHTYVDIFIPLGKDKTIVITMHYPTM